MVDVQLDCNTVSSVTSALDAGLVLIGRGWAVLPLYDVDANGVCTCWQRERCPTPGKHPRLDTGVKGASSEERTIRRWLERQWPNRCNLGIATGRASGLVVIDVDPKHDGFATLAVLEAQLGPLPSNTPRVRTGSGGLHVYLAYPSDGSTIRNSEGRIGAGIDVRGDGGYVVAPQSITNKGSYTWLTDGALAPIPAAWLAKMRPAATRQYTSRTAARPGERGDASLPLGLAAQEFLEHGVPYGQQRSRALAATRNLLARGTSVEETIDLVWHGLRSSPQEDGKRPWTRADAEAIVLDLERTAPKELCERDAELTQQMRAAARLRRRRLIARAVQVG